MNNEVIDAKNKFLEARAEFFKVLLENKMPLKLQARYKKYEKDLQNFISEIRKWADPEDEEINMK